MIHKAPFCKFLPVGQPLDSGSSGVKELLDASCLFKTCALKKTNQVASRKLCEALTVKACNITSRIPSVTNVIQSAAYVNYQWGSNNVIIM